MAVSKDTTPISVADAVYEILSETGINILMDARALRGALLDKGPDNPEIRVLKNCLSNRVMRPFQQILETEEILLKEKRLEAIDKALHTMVNVEMAEPKISRAAIIHINEGIELYLISVGAIEPEPETKSEDGPKPKPEPPKGPGKSPKPIPWKLIGAIAGVLICVLSVGVGVSAALRYVFRQQQVVQFDGNGADSGFIAAISFAESGKIVLPENAFDRKGYQFVGWSENKKGEGLLNPGLELDVSEPMTLYAAWGAIVSFDGNGADGGEPNESIVAAPNGSVTLPKSTFKRSGFRVWGWCSSKDGDESYSGNTEVSVDGPTTFYAMWRAQASFKGNGATEGKTEAVAEDENGDIKLPECGFKRAGCSFIGWYRASSDFEKNPTYNDKDLMQPGHSLNLAGSPMSFYACWKYDDATVKGVHVEEITRDGKEGKTYILLLRNDTDYTMDLQGEMRYVAQDKTLGSTRIKSPSVAPGETVAQTYANYDMGNDGRFEYTLAARPPQHGGKSLGSCITKGEIVRDGGLMTIEITNTNTEKTVHILDAKAYGYQPGMSTTGGFAYCGGEGYDKELSPGESTIVTFGDKEWPAQWNQMNVETYFDGYAE